MKPTPKFRYLVVVRGKGTTKETRTRTNVKLYPVKLKSGETKWCSIPE